MNSKLNSLSQREVFRRAMRARARRRNAVASVVAAVGFVLLVLVLGAGAIALNALVVMLLWGAVGPAFDVHGPWRTISFGQAILASLVMVVFRSIFSRNS